MAGIYIKDMDLPDANHCITLTVFSDGCVCRGAEIIGRAIPVPDHGRLGDLDALAALAESIAEKYPRWRLSGGGLAVVCREAGLTPTIIPADKDGDAQ